MTDGLPDQNQTKTCTKCKETKPVTEFYVLRPRKYGGYSYRPSCKQCDSKGAMAWAEKNRDKVNERRREQYHNSERAQRAKSAREEALRQKRLEMARWPFTERACRKCGETKPIEEFAKGDGGDLRRVCKECKAEQHRQWRANNPEHVKEWHREYGQMPERKAAHTNRQRHYYYKDPQGRRARTMRKKGLSVDEYDAMLARQNGVCAICGTVCKSGRALAVDHDHITGEVRGLLCMNCNRAIGWLNDDPELIMRAAEYVLSYRKP